MFEQFPTDQLVHGNISIWFQSPLHLALPHRWSSICLANHSLSTELSNRTVIFMDSVVIPPDRSIAYQLSFNKICFLQLLHVEVNSSTSASGMNFGCTR